MSARITGTISRVHYGSQVAQVRRTSGVTTVVIRGPMPVVGQRVTLEREEDRGWRVVRDGCVYAAGCDSDE